MFNLPLTADGNLDVTQLTRQQRDEVKQMSYATLFSIRGKEEWWRESGNDPPGKFTFAGFEMFYWGLFGRPLPRHAEAWMREFFDEYAKGKRRFLIKAFRGSTKSTEFAITLPLYYLAEFPEHAELIVQKNDTAASNTSEDIAKIIKDSASWRVMCPTLTPDAKWGADGYDIKDTSMEGPLWQQKVLKARTKDPSFVALGWASGTIAGMHPHLLVIDDIHDEENTRSDREIKAVIDSLKSNILQTLNRPPGDDFEPLCIVVYTPWTETDAYAYLESTGLYYQIATPLYAPTTEDDPKGFIYDGDFVRLAWDGVSDPVAYINAKKVEQGAKDFFRMSLLDLKKAAARQALPYYGYDADAIRIDWVMVGGVDPKNTFRLTQSNGDHTSYFALAYVAKIPQGGAVVVGGVLEQCSLARSLTYIEQAQSMFPAWRYTRVEDVGGGAVTLQALILLNPTLRLVGSDVSNLNRKKGRIRSKSDRIQTEMMPWFEKSIVRISTANTPFLNALRRLFTNFYDLDPEHSPEFDAGDAVYHALKGMPEVLVLTQAGEELPGLRKQRAASPFMFGRM